MLEARRVDFDQRQSNRHSPGSGLLAQCQGRLVFHYLTNVFRPERCLRSRKHPVSGGSSRVNWRHPGPPADPVGVIATVGQHPFRLWQAAQHGTQEPGAGERQATRLSFRAIPAAAATVSYVTTERSERAARCWIPRPEAENPFAEIIPTGKPMLCERVFAALEVHIQTRSAIDGKVHTVFSWVSANEKVDAVGFGDYARHVPKLSTPTFAHEALVAKLHRDIVFLVFLDGRPGGIEAGNVTLAAALLLEADPKVGPVVERSFYQETVAVVGDLSDLPRPGLAPWDKVDCQCRAGESQDQGQRPRSRMFNGWSLNFTPFNRL